MKQHLRSIRITQLITKVHQLYVAELLLRQAAILLIELQSLVVLATVIYIKSNNFSSVQFDLEPP